MTHPPVSTDVLAQLRHTAEQVAALPADSSIVSPCISVCRMDPGSGLCEGCLRTIDEIRQWSRASDDVKRVLWHRLAERAAALAVPAS